MPGRISLRRNARCSIMAGAAAVLTAGAGVGHAVVTPLASHGVRGDLEARGRQALAMAAPGAQLAAVAMRHSPSGAHLRLRQEVAGVPVWRAEAVVSFDTTEKPVLLASDLYDAVPTGVHKALIDVASAERTALQAAEARRLYAEPNGELFWRPASRAENWRLAYRVRFACEQPMGDWEVWVDADNAGVLEIRDRTVYAKAQGTAALFRPDPVTASGDRRLRDNNDAASAVPDAAYETVSLRDLQISGDVFRLSGPHVLVEDWETPVQPPAISTDGNFYFTREEPGFEDVMVYYHIDTMQRWFQEIGFQDANNRPQPADAHGFDGLDNSKYVPSLGKLSFGEGGVDDAEDAAVIVHEYAHATQHDIVPTWGEGGHTRAMGEGFGDYLANSYAYSLQPERVRAWNAIFLWDGNNEFWPGRVAVDRSLSYPADAEQGLHRAGTLWCSILTDILYELGDRAMADRLILDHHYALTGSATMEDAAAAILMSDVTLYRGAHLNALMQVFRRWGLPVEAPDVPAASGLIVLRASPNPCNPQTTLRYTIPQDGSVQLDLFDAAGRHLHRLLRTRQQAGTYSLDWDGNTQGGLPAASGTYLVRLQAAGGSVCRKITLLR